MGTTVAPVTCCSFSLSADTPSSYVAITPRCKKRREMSRTSSKRLASGEPLGECFSRVFRPLCAEIGMTYQAGCKSRQKVRRAQARACQEEMAGSDGSRELGNHRESTLLLVLQQPKKTTRLKEINPTEAWATAPMFTRRLQLLCDLCEKVDP